MSEPQDNTCHCVNRVWMQGCQTCHDKEVLDKAAERIREAVYEPTGATTDAVNAVWPDHVKLLIEHGVAMMVEAAIAEICIAAVRGEGEQE